MYLSRWQSELIERIRELEVNERKSEQMIAKLTEEKEKHRESSITFKKKNMKLLDEIELYDHIKSKNG